MSKTTQVNHLAIILDGNRRWAKQRGLSSSQGHMSGMENLETICMECKKRGIRYLTVYAFSTENWGRSAAEVKALMKIFELAIKRYVPMLKREGMQLNVIGRIKDFPKSLQSAIDKAIHQLKDGKDGMLTMSLSYGGRDEIVRAAEKAMKLKGKLTEEIFANLLDTAGMPDPDLIIRTGGNQRLSNFLPWQSTYSELYFTETFWPAFSAKHLDRALADYENRQRNFGK